MDLAQKEVSVGMRIWRAFSGVMAGALVGAGLATSATTLAQEGKPPLTMASLGGALTRSQILANVQPYRQLKNRWMKVERYDGRLDRIRDQVRSANVKWDLVTIDLPAAIAACDEGLLEPLDHGILPPAPDGTPATKDLFRHLIWL